MCFFFDILVMPKICSEEYDKVTCIFLGVQAELSMIALDLAMVLFFGISGYFFTLQVFFFL